MNVRIAYWLAGLLWLGGSLSLPAPAAGAAQTSVQPVRVTAQEIKESTAEYQVNIQIPVISGLLDSQYQAQLNQTISAQARQDRIAFIAKARAQAEEMRKAGYPVRPVSLTVTYEVHALSPILSLRVITDEQMGGTSKPRADYYNIDNTQPARRLQLKDLYGAGYKETLDREISRQIDARIEQGIPYFKEQFHGISDTQGFFIDRGGVVVVFDKYDIAAGYVGMPEFWIPWAGKLQQKSSG
jgi:hypothetical protein